MSCLRRGIDVSNNNKGRFPATGVDFMFTKTSQGTGFDDRFFEGYIKDAKSRGIPWVPYHFAEPDTEHARGRGRRGS